MKKEDLQNSQNRIDNTEDKDELRDELRNQKTNVSGNQLNDIAHEAGLGRHRMTYIEDLEGMDGKNNYAGSNNDNDLSNRDLNASNDQ